MEFKISKLMDLIADYLSEESSDGDTSDKNSSRVKITGNCSDAGPVSGRVDAR